MKTLTSLALLGSLALCGCGVQANAHYQTQEKQQQSQKTVSDSTQYSFDNIGYTTDIRKIKFNYTGTIAITAGDFDGDGDVDVAVIQDNGILRFYENKIPQKNKQ